MPRYLVGYSNPQYDDAFDVVPHRVVTAGSPEEAVRQHFLGEVPGARYLVLDQDNYTAHVFTYEERTETVLVPVNN